MEKNILTSNDPAHKATEGHQRAMHGCHKKLLSLTVPKIFWMVNRYIKTITMLIYSNLLVGRT